MPVVNKVAEVVDQFQHLGALLGAAPYGNGHINETYAITLAKGSTPRRYILQRINREVFKQPEQVMDNLQKVLTHLRRKLEQAGADDLDRRVLTLLPTDDDKPYAVDHSGDIWRAFHFIGDATTFDLMDDPAKAFQAGVAFGQFQNELADFDARELHETIPDFHHTPRRLEALQQAIAEDVLSRADEARAEIEHVLSHADWAPVVTDRMADGRIPMRITHNDTKLNNVMIDNDTARAICVIDLDTVMPGSVLFDFGDLVRTATNTGREDERDLRKVSCNFDIFVQLAEGYLSVAHFLTDEEKALLPFSGKLLAYENAIRFLTDYLKGDVYFRIHRETHNLDRCRAQMCLAESIHSLEPRMRSHIDAICSRA